MSGGRAGWTGETHEDQGEDFNPPREGPLPPHYVAQFADRQGLGDGAGGREGVGQVVEAVGDGGILHDVALVQDVGPGGGDFDEDLVWVAGGHGGHEGHATEELRYLGCSEGETRARVDV